MPRISADTGSYSAAGGGGELGSGSERNPARRASRTPSSPPCARSSQADSCYRLGTERAYVTASPQVFAPEQIGVIEEASCNACWNWPVPG
jgi:hypothetical protein